LSQTPSELPPPPAQQATSPTEIAGQQVAPSTPVPHVPGAVTGAKAGSTNNLAVISLVAALASIPGHIIPLVGPFTLSLVAIVTGFMARRQIRRSGESGMGLATAGMVIGIIHATLLVIAVVAIVFFVFVLGVAMFGFSAHSH
jgi:hypothetical protein